MNYLNSSLPRSQSLKSSLFCEYFLRVRMRCRNAQSQEAACVHTSTQACSVSSTKFEGSVRSCCRAARIERARHTASLCVVVCCWSPRPRWRRSRASTDMSHSSSSDEQSSSFLYHQTYI